MATDRPSEPVQDILTRLRRIDDELPPDDGAAVFNRMYLTVTESVAAGLASDTVFQDPVFMEQLDVTFVALARTVGMASRYLLTPTLPPVD
jgi:hypothetical protein